MQGMKKHIPWLAAALILVVIFASIYIVVQQSQRSDADSPQIQMAEDAASALDQGASPQTLVGPNVDMAHSLAPFVIIYDRTGRLVAGAGLINGAAPTPPMGVLTSATGQPYHIVTWQPEPGVRIAAATIAANRYYVLAGRSITEVEKNETKTLELSLFGGLSAWLVLAVAWVLTRPGKRRS
jgi:hypothetical protein